MTKTAQELGREPIAYTRHTTRGELGSHTYGSVGLTKRELFAAMLAQGMAASGNRNHMADSAVQEADRLLEELVKEQT